ncbi:MAG: dihydrolipoamide succinyltransferase [Bacteroidetes bacterium GWE2_42_24]|nr:MAG: dihydrolipoamide succinyltransferase [Bacteroidetes bacterium GWE2_42_24]OFY29181.1 MAG: dihydrolipoamide succinyltransferase [Bacteroidetes bacterium GWF2_43_11]
MRIEIKIPSPGESISQVQVATWLVANGEMVEKDQEIAEIDSDKATLSISAPESGIVSQVIPAGDMAAVGAVIATLDTKAKPVEESAHESQPNLVVTPSLTPAAMAEVKEPVRKTVKVAATPVARKLMELHNVNESSLRDFYTHYHFSREDVEFYLQHKTEMPDTKQPAVQPAAKDIAFRSDERQPMSPLRRKLAERLVAVKNQTAMLTTFNEINMTPVMELRAKYKDAFQKKHGVGLGFMSFFTRACAVALKSFPQVNASIDGDEIVLHHYSDIGIAVSTPKGLMVPVVRDAETLALADIEHKIKYLASRARDKKLTLDEMSGGTFTITNGGVFGSLLSTPIINPPQSAILGMHNIVERPIAVKGKVEIHPMMYVALSYDHRVIDGRESVSFLVKVKQLLENPVHLIFEGGDAEIELLGL